MANRPFPPLPEKDLLHAVSLVAEDLWTSLSGKRIFLTGGTGFVGKWLLASLAEADRKFGINCEVVVLSRDPLAFKAQAPHLAKIRGLHFIEGDVRNFTCVKGRFDWVIHAATDVATRSTATEIYDTCVLGTRRVLEFAAEAGCQDFFLISSGAIYGQQPPELVSMSENYINAPKSTQPQTAYGKGKLDAELIANVLAKEFRYRMVTARLFAFVGPYLALDKQFAIGNFLRDAMAGKSIVIQGDGTAVRSYLYSADMAGWLWNIFFRGQAGKAYNVGSGQEISIAELAERVNLAVGSMGGINIRGMHTLGMLPDRYVPDISLARDELGLIANFSLEESLRRTVEWYRS